MVSIIKLVRLLINYRNSNFREITKIPPWITGSGKRFIGLQVLHLLKVLVSLRCFFTSYNEPFHTTGEFNYSTTNYPIRGVD